MHTIDRSGKVLGSISLALPMEKGTIVEVIQKIHQTFGVEIPPDTEVLGAKVQEKWEAYIKKWDEEIFYRLTNHFSRGKASPNRKGGRKDRS